MAKWVYTGNIKGAVGAQGIKGDTGAAGVTPQKGIDYWTDSEKQEIISAAAAEVDISGKLDKTGDSANAKVTFTSGDNVNPTGFANIDLVSSGEKHGSLMRKFSLTVKNVRYLWKMIGTTDISAIGGGTLTGAINALNTDLDTTSQTANAAHVSRVINMHPDVNTIGLEWLNSTMRMVVDGVYVETIATSSDLSKKITEHTGVIGTSPYASKNFNDYGNYFGIWSCGDPTNCVNCPAPTSIGVLVSFGSGVYSAQLYITISHLYHRIYIPTG